MSFQIDFYHAHANAIASMHMLPGCQSGVNTFMCADYQIFGLPCTLGPRPNAITWNQG